MDSIPLSTAQIQTLSDWIQLRQMASDELITCDELLEQLASMVK